MQRPVHLRLTLAWAALAVALGTACSKAPARPLRLATNTWLGYEPLYLARQLGALPETQVRLLEMPNSTDCMRALRAGLVDAAALTLDEALTLLAEDIDLRVVLVTDVSNGADVLLARPGLRSLGELRGRRVGVESTAVGAYLLSRALDAAGMGPQDIRAVTITENSHVNAYLDGAVDALVTFEPSRSRLLAAGARSLFDSSQIPGEIVDLVVVRADAARGHAADLERLRTAWFTALDRMRSEPEASARRMAPREGLDGPTLLAALQGLSFPPREEEERLRTRQLLPLAGRLSALMVRHRLLRVPVDATPLLAPPPDAGGP